MRIFDPKNETMQPAALAQLQLERLQALVARLKRNVRRYREMMGDLRIEAVEEIEKLPLTEMTELADSFPYGMFALPLQEVIRLHSAVGPDGRQLVVGHTRNDLAQWGRLVARQLVAAGVNSSDVIQICFGNGQFGRALGCMLGAELIEASVIPDDPSHVDYQLAMLRNYKTTVLVTSPANARELANLIEARSIDSQALFLRTVILSRPVDEAVRNELKRALSATIKCSFGVSEALDPGLCVECKEGNLHANEDHFLVESKNGELILTTMCREATPLLRYRTRIACDIVRMPCACGRTGAILKPGRRLDDRRLVNETPIYPAQVEAVLACTKAAGQKVTIEILESKVVISIVVTKPFFSDTMRTMIDLQQEIASEVLTRLGIKAEIRFIS